MDQELSKPIYYRDFHAMLEKIVVSAISELCPEQSKTISIKRLHEFLDAWIDENFTTDENKNE